MKSTFLKIRVSQYVCLAVCFLLMAIIPLARENRIFGIPLHVEEGAAEQEEVVSEDADGTTVINTTSLCRDVIGYAGPTPLEIRLKEGKIVKIKVLENRETPEYIGAVVNSRLFDSYYGLTLEQAAELKPDAVSGATYSSGAVIKNIKSGIAYALDAEPIAVEDHNAELPLDARFYVTLAIILSGALVPIFVKNRIFRSIQLGLDVLILGFWGGTFVCYSQMVSYMTNGVTQVIMIPVVLMMVTAFIYPLFGKPDHYCNWLCPYGALQELASKCVPYKLKLSSGAVKVLTVFREVLWFALMWLLWTGIWFDWMGYEPFAAFFFLDASPIVLGIAGGFIVLSLFVNRPYCRFVCPTGSLFKFAEGRR